MTWYTIGWIIWGVYFIALEMAAFLDRDPYDTLSEHIWHALTGVKKWWQWPARAAIIAFCVWLALHLSFHMFWI